MNEDHVWAEVRAERREQVELLAALHPEQWDGATLCAGWRVREVVAHTTLPYRISLGRTVLELLRARGSIDRMADRSARRDAAELPAERLLGSLRDNVEHRWTPPGGGAHGALSHDVIHGLDITVGLGLDRRVPPERVGLVLSGMKPRNVAYFGADLTGVALHATDLDWSLGSGAALRGLAQDLLLVLCGRRLPPGRLDGAAAARFSVQSAPR
ncbi:maleylpyruvate isomerase family mycothiol-dependent enzyme [Micromonospora sp. WMMD1102]|uniref:maleylpyruvate isomerase family mycothiol-dependent enzyme n=1 Tax=Micromonospora sp. WMMD1102 TaxID=3016105 RepID=UPI0024159057|nr:maleylpyruvate isomerase family mycothiol-dependent enzyme [Micromonospora sp. WMMD1102]MDG4786592.1 maleylpyruvate isomerase family mycothiol-dependent enzyme [Micromonospora sp. WMMD1102]